MLRCIDTDGFDRSRSRFEEVVNFLDGDGASALSHADLENRLDTEGRELIRLLYQDHLDLRAEREERLGEVLDADGVDRPSVEPAHRRTLTTIFGEVAVTRLAYRRRGQPNLHPADATLNLPVEHHSHGIRRLAAVEAARGSFDDAAGAIHARTGTHVGKRQVEELTARAAADFAAFYTSRARPRAAPDEVVVVSVDAKGIVMRPEALRPATQSAAARSTTKLETRLSKGEKRNRKRLARSAPSTRWSPCLARAATCSHTTTTPTFANRRPRPRTSGSPPAWSMTPPPWWPPCSTKPSDETQPMSEHG